MINRNYTTIFTCLTLIFLLLCGTAVSAASIKDRMVARLPAINELKNKGLIGEDNKGYLEYRSDQRPQQDVVQEENNDRKTVYEAIAKKQGANLTLVGQRRAQQIEENGSPGHWYQNQGGKWYKK